jgi:glycosyltransferase involved in cell wall biosynthesis
MKILYVARLLPYKDPLTFISASRCLPQHEFVVLGDGELMGECRSRAKDNVVFRGWVNQQDVADAMQDADVFCQLATFENLWSSSLQQAMKHGLAIVTTDAGYTSTVFKNMENCLLIPVGDVKSLVTALTKLEDEQLRFTVSEKSFRYYVEKLQVSQVAKQVKKILASSVDGKRKKPVKVDREEEFEYKRLQTLLTHHGYTLCGSYCNNEYFRFMMQKRRR